MLSDLSQNPTELSNKMTYFGLFNFKVHWSKVVNHITEKKKEGKMARL